jgi:hypothetical protein
MTTIKLNPLPGNIYNKFTEDYITVDTIPTEPYNFIWEFDNTADAVKFKMTNTTDNTIQYNFVIPLEIIKNTPGYETQALIAISDNANKKFLVKLDEETGQDIPTTQAERAVPHVVSEDDLIEITHQTLSTKANLDTANTKQDAPSGYQLPIADVYLRILVPYKNCPANELVFTIKVLDDEFANITYVNKDSSPVDVTTMVATYQTNIAQPNKIFNPLTITADKNNPVAGDVIKLTVTSENTNVPEVYAEPVAGFINKTKIKLTNGVGTVTVDSDGLETGDVVQIKFGYKYFSNVANYTKTLA